MIAISLPVDGERGDEVDGVTGNHKGRDEASSLSTLRGIDVIGGRLRCRCVDEGFAPSRPLRSPVRSRASMSFCLTGTLMPTRCSNASFWVFRKCSTRVSIVGYSKKRVLLICSMSVRKAFVNWITRRESRPYLVNGSAASILVLGRLSTFPTCSFK